MSKKGVLIPFPEYEPDEDEQDMEDEAMQLVLNRMFSDNWQWSLPTTEELPIINLEDYRRRN